MTQQGRNQYDSLPPPERKQFFDAWFADEMKNGETTSSGSKDIGSEKQIGSNFQWVSKHQLITLLGNVKAEARVASNKLLTRPDPVTGLSDEWSLEYKLHTDVGSEMGIEKINHRLQTDVSVEGEVAKTEALEDMSAARLHEAGSASSAPAVYIKKEPSTEAQSAQIKMTEAEKRLSKSTDTLTKNPRQILKVIWETVTTLKVMYQATKAIRYTEALNEDIGKLLPKFKSDFAAVESLVTRSDLESYACTEEGEAVIRAVAVKLEHNYEQFNELCEWHAKFNRDQSKKQKKS